MSPWNTDKGIEIHEMEFSL